MESFLNRTYFALFIALLIHILFILLFLLFKDNLNITSPTPIKKEKRLKISLKDIQQTKVKQKATQIAPPMPKGSQLKKISKHKIVKPIKKRVPKPKIIKPIKKKSIQKKKILKKLKKIEKPIIKKKELFIPLLKPKEHKEIKKVTPVDPMAWMYEDKSSKEIEKEEQKNYSQNNINQNIKELYGDEFGKLTKGQQEYILDNQEIMRRITQEVLTRVASVNIGRDIRVNRTNIIEFYLHPNGDMTDFRFLHKSGVFTLDRTTKETIEYAYSRYPRPKEKTLIRYNVFYRLSNY